MEQYASETLHTRTRRALSRGTRGRVRFIKHAVGSAFGIDRNNLLSKLPRLLSLGWNCLHLVNTARHSWKGRLGLLGHLEHIDRDFTFSAYIMNGSGWWHRNNRIVRENCFYLLLTLNILYSAYLLYLRAYFLTLLYLLPSPYGVLPVFTQPQFMDETRNQSPRGEEEKSFT